MIKSMTGFGKAEFEVNNKKIILELKSLNSKQIDINVRTPPVYREKEIEIRKELSENLGKFQLSENIDKNRFEQELVFYLDKMDMNEEKIRLTNHCNYFLETLAHPLSNGRKLNFISQEMGREINTLGSKAYDSSIQRIVVKMKDHLERIKELLLNVF